MAGTVRKRARPNRQGEIKVTWLADYTDQHGKRHNRTFARERDAKRWLEQTQVEVRGGLHTADADSITVGEAAELWLRRRQAKLLERATLRTYRGYVDHIVPLIGRLKLSRLTTPMIEEFADRLTERLSWARAQKVLSALKMIISNAQRRGLIAQNAALPVKMEEDERSGRPLAAGVDVPTVAEMRAIIEAAPPRHRVRLLLAAFTGLRASELRALSWSEIDWTRNVLCVSRRADWWGTVGRPKSRNAYREVPLIPRLVTALKEWRLASPASALVFPGQGGAVLHHTTLQLDFKSVQKAAGVVTATGAAKYHLHTLRHFFASWEITQRAPPKRLQQLMGHGSIKMTYDTYGHWLADVEDDHTRFAAGEVAVFGKLG